MKKTGKKEAEQLHYTMTCWYCNKGFEKSLTESLLKWLSEEDMALGTVGVCDQCSGDIQECDGWLIDDSTNNQDEYFNKTG